MSIHHEQPDQSGRTGVNRSSRSKPNGQAQHVPCHPFDEVEARRFLSMLDADADAFLFAAGDDDKERKKRLIAEAKTANKAKPTLWHHRRGSIDQALRWIEEQQEKGWGVFVSVQAMKAAKCQIAKLAYTRAVYAEMDIGEPLQPWPVEPSIIVETSPGRCHVYWLVLADTPITDADFHGIMMRLVETYGSDPDSKDLARRLRLPGTWNLKPGREPHLVKVIHETGARHSRDELLAAFPPPSRPKPSASTTRPIYNGHTPPGLERFVGQFGGGPIWSIRPDRYGDWLRVGMALHAETGGGADGLALWDRWSAASGSEKWAPGVCEDKWKSFGGRNAINGGTLFYMARESGWVEPTQTRPASASSHTRQSYGRREKAPEANDGGPAPALEYDEQISIETSVNALVKGVLHPGDVTALFGPSGVGKTFAAIDLAYHIALGRPWQGRRVRQTPVLYVGLEGIRGLRHRMAAYARHMGSAGRMLARLTIHTPLDKSEVGRGGEATIVEQAKALGNAAGKPVGLIIIDTLARAIAGDDENSAQDMAAFVGRISTIARETGAAVLVVHHPGKDDARGMRGSTALFAACDAVIKISSSGNVREVTTEKVKDGVIGPLFAYTLKQVSLGTDEDGDEITSCIVEAVNSPPTPRRIKLSVQHQRALDQLHRLYTDGVARCIDPKEIDLADIDPRCIPRIVTREEWRKRCDAAGLSTTGKPGSERAAFKRSVDELEKAGLIARYGEYVWLLGQKSGTAEWTSREDVR